MSASRLLPLLLCVAFISLGVRLNDIREILKEGGNWQVMQSSQAEPPQPAAPTPTGAEAAPKATPPAARPQKAGGAEAPAMTEVSPPAAAPADPRPSNQEAADGDLIAPDELTSGELKVLQSLSARREEIDKRGRELDAREALMAAADQRVDQKLKEMQGLREELKGLLRQVDEQQRARVTSLVKIYETMKPREAAAVLESLDMDVALDVITSMKEAKSAPILAAMTPQKASEITVRMMQRQKLPDNLPN